MATKSFFHYAQYHRDYFLKNCQKVVYKKGQVVVWPEDDNPWIYFLASGLVQVSFTINTGDERLVGYFVPGQTFAQSGSFYQDQGGGLEYIAAEKSEMYRMPRKEFLARINNNILFARDYNQILLKNQIFLIDRIVYQGESSIYRRTLRWLLFMAKYYCADAPGFDCRIIVPLTHADIANFLHVTRESAGKHINGLIKHDLIKKEQKYILIPSLAAIEDRLNGA